ncbi:basic proline-rich protein precursor [Streptomyces sp. NL15-2K]|nr:basic proline-rich protein precursor [Streptomyces sp. NL15-2K]
MLTRRQKLSRRDSRPRREGDVPGGVRPQRLARQPGHVGERPIPRRSEDRHPPARPRPPTRHSHANRTHPHRPPQASGAPAEGTRRHPVDRRRHRRRLARPPEAPQASGATAGGRRTHPAQLPEAQPPGPTAGGTRKAPGATAGGRRTHRPNRQRHNAPGPTAGGIRKALGAPAGGRRTHRPNRQRHNAPGPTAGGIRKAPGATAGGRRTPPAQPPEAPAGNSRRRPQMITSRPDTTSAPGAAR